MNKANDVKYKHLTIEDREIIEAALSANYQLKEIANQLGKDSTTISKEIKKNREYKENKMEFSGGCSNRKNCNVKHLCGAVGCSRLCRNCKQHNCYRICPEFMTKQCSRHDKYPHVCNGCDTKIGCRLSKYTYRAKSAHVAYLDGLSTSREGISLTQHELERLDQLISPLVKKGQSLSHIYVHHKDEIGCSERTLYNYFEMNLFTARNIDLRRKVRFKPRKSKWTKNKRETQCRQGRTYKDFESYVMENPDVSVVEMDTVKGTRSGKVLLTLFFRNCSLMVATLMDACTQECVNAVINGIYQDIGHEAFEECFPIILTDNGSEFKNPESIEFNKDGTRRTRVFYCDPLASHQKGKLERNHEYIRYIFPKGKSLDMLTQEKVTLMNNHINSAARASLNGVTPFKLADLLLNRTFLESQSLVEIHPDDVHLRFALIK